MGLDADIYEQADCSRLHSGPSWSVLVALGLPCTYMKHIESRLAEVGTFLVVWHYIHWAGATPELMLHCAKSLVRSCFSGCTYPSHIPKSTASLLSLPNIPHSVMLCNCDMLNRLRSSACQVSFRLADLLQQGPHVGCLKCMPEGSKLIQDTAQAPDVTLMVILAILSNFRAEVIPAGKIRQDGFLDNTSKTSIALCMPPAPSL